MMTIIIGANIQAKQHGHASAHELLTQPLISLERPLWDPYVTFQVRSRHTLGNRAHGMFGVQDISAQVCQQ